MKKGILLFSIIFYCSSMLAAELDIMKNDAEKRALCSKDNMCFINTKGHKGIYVVKVNTVSISKNGIININHYQFKRYTYTADGKFLKENVGK